MGELKELLDTRMRITTSKMDQLIHDLDASAETAESVSVELQNIKVRLK